MTVFVQVCECVVRYFFLILGGGFFKLVVEEVGAESGVSPGEASTLRDLLLVHETRTMIM